MPNPNEMTRPESKDLCRVIDDGPDFPVTASVSKLEKNHRKTTWLLGEIITTFRLEPNQKWFSENMPDNWGVTVAGWIKRYDRLQNG